MIRDTIRMLIALNHPTLLSRNSLKSIRDLHDELSNRMSLKLKNLTNRKYPAPPIDGIELEVEFVLHKYKWNSSVSIKPILNTFRLAKEAEEMKHCCLSYDDAIQQRRSYLYSIHAGKHRGTLEIIPNRRDQSWRIHQLKGKYNHTNFPKTLMTILEDWVSESKRLEIKHAPKSAREKNSEKSKILLGNQPLLFDLFEETIE
ncbi:MAG: PcfJ domain-containing protein [Candidatus Omnitrophica bacterium]|nr:PcfJ domain-containing protein [Candidatus Omnitrophota bacterium]